MKTKTQRLLEELDEEIFETQFVTAYRDNTIEELLDGLHPENMLFASGVLYAKYLQLIKDEGQTDSFCLDCTLDMLKVLKIIAGPEYVEYAHRYVSNKEGK